MRAWQIIVTSAVLASVAVAVLFWPGAISAAGGAASLFETYWPGVAIVWLGVYGVAALVLSTAAAFRELDDAASGQLAPDWARRYLLRLGVTQYFSAVLVLLALGLLPIAVSTEPFFSVPGMIGPSLALTACAAAILLGVLGWIVVTGAAAFRTPVDWTSSPAPVLAAASPANPDTQFLQEIVERLRARPAEPFSANAELVEQLRQRDRSTLEAIKELAGAVGRVRNGVSEIQHGLQHHRPEQNNQDGSAALADIANTAGELRAAIATLTTMVAKLEDIAGGLATLSPVGLLPAARGSLPAGSRSQLSTQLQELLRDIATAPAPHQESSR